MNQIRLSPLALFLILLAVILIGFLMHHTWESFTNNRDGFHTNYADTTIVSQALYGQYSRDNAKIAKLTENLYFDPVTKVIIEKFGDILYMKRKDGSDLSYNVKTSEILVNDLGMGSVVFDGMVPSVATNINWSAKTVADAKSYFRDISDNRVVYMDIIVPSNLTLSQDTDIIGSPSAVSVYFNSSTNIATSDGTYPVLGANTSQFRKYNRVLGPKGMIVSNATTTKNPISFGWYTKNGYGVVVVPIVVNEQPTNSTFIHIMDIINNKHVAVFYFKGNEVEMYNFTNTSIVPSGKSIPADTSSTSSDVSFAGKITDIQLPHHVSGENLNVDVKHDSSKGLVYIAGKVGSDVYRAYIKISEDRVPVIVKYESGNGTSTSASKSSTSESDISELNKTLHLIKSMQDGSPYVLKTEVVPPVCSTCPSCSPSNGVCTNCGGNGGSGTYNHSHSTGGLGKNVVNEVAGIGHEAVGLGKDIVKGAGDVVSGTGSFLKDSGSGIGQFAKDSASGVYGAAKDSASGVYGATKDSASGVYGATKDVIGGTVGIGREILGGVGGLLKGHDGQGYHNSYGGPQYNNNNNNQGGYLNPKQAHSAGQDPYSYYGTLPARDSGTNFMPRTADFSSFGR